MNRKAKRVKIVRGAAPANSLIVSFLPANYLDVYECEGECNLTPDDIMIAFWTAQPKWITALFRIRNFLVKPFKLKGGDQHSAQRLPELIRSGGSEGIISIPAKSDTETVMQLADSHLTAELSVYNNYKKITVTTTVHFHNRLGRLYFFAIRPFHSLIVRAMINKLTIDR